jgi:GNAT superfamily N-acetyltransferase
MTTQAERHHIVLRSETSADRAVSLAAHASTRVDELALTGWTPVQQDAFVAQQFDAQQRHFRAQYPHAAFDIVCVDGIDGGRCYVDRDARRICLVDIVLLPEWRGIGVGGRLLGGLLAEADAQGVPITLHVGKNNPILGWYARLGFVIGGDAGMHWAMQRPAQPQAPNLEAAA